MKIRVGFKGFLFISLFLLLFSFAVSRARAQDNQEMLSELSRQIRSSLQESKQSQQVLMTQLAEAITDSEKSKQQVQELELHLTSLQNSLNDTSNLLMTYAEKTSVLGDRLKASGNRVFWLSLICIVFLLLKVARIVLGIIPQTAPWVNAMAATKIGKYVDIII